MESGSADAKPSRGRNDVVSITLRLIAAVILLAGLGLFTIHESGEGVDALIYPSDDDSTGRAIFCPTLARIFVDSEAEEDIPEHRRRNGLATWFLILGTSLNVGGVLLGRRSSQ